MSKMIRCACAGKSECKLCGGVGQYPYTPSERGYIPFVCPSCEGKKEIVMDGGEKRVCLTCKGEGMIDPANPPPAGMLDVMMKIFFGA